MRLDLIEACPDKPKDLKVFEISLFAIGTYAETLGAYELRVMHPINAQVRDYYAGFGLTYVSRGDYLYTTLSDSSMSKKVENLSKHRNKKKPRTVEESAKAAARRFRDMAPNDIEEPEGLASGDMDKFLEDPDTWEKEGDDERE